MVEACWLWRGRGLACSEGSTVGTGRGRLEGVGEKDAIGGRARLKVPARRPGAGALILTCGALLLLLLLGVGNQLGGVQGVGGQGLRLQGGGGALWWGGWRTRRGGQGRGFVAPRQRRPAQGRLLGLQQPAICLVVQSAPFGLQATVIPFFLSPLQAGTEKCKGQTRSEGTTATPLGLAGQERLISPSPGPQ